MDTSENDNTRQSPTTPTTGFDKPFLSRIINRSAETPTDRRRFLRQAGLVGVGLAAAGTVMGAGTGVAAAATTREDAATGAISDATILNFALNLEYLEANFYHYAVYGSAIPTSLMSGTGTQGGITGGAKVSFKSTAVKQLAQQIATDELDHVQVLRGALGSAAVAQPAIDLSTSFTAAAQAAGVISSGQTFNPYSSDDDFLLGAFIFEDVGVTAYKGAAPLISNKSYLTVAAGILAVEAYHASALRTRIYDAGLASTADKIAALRNTVGGPKGVNDGPTVNGVENIVPDNGNNGQVYGRTPGSVLNIVYLTAKTASSGGFYPNGVNGPLHTSGPMVVPSGAPATGGGGTAGIQDKGLLIGGGSALAGAAVAAGLAARNHRKPVPAHGIDPNDHGGRGNNNSSDHNNPTGDNGHDDGTET